MPSEMVELVARAIGDLADAWAAGEGCDDVDVLSRAYRVALAHAAIAAMREPTEAMLEAAGPAFREVDAILAIHELVRGRGPIAYPDQEPPLIHAWRAMIDAALKE